MHEPADQDQLFHEFLNGLVIYANIVVMQFFCDSAVSISFFVFVEDYNNLFLYHLVFGRILRLVQIVVERAARKSGKLQQCFQRVFLPQFLNYLCFLFWRSSSSTKAFNFFK